jgi:FHS family Na+ dependent glucose MFS transporter 1
LSTEPTPPVAAEFPTRRSGRDILRHTFAYYAAFVALGLIVGSLGPTLTGLADNTNSLLSEVSVIFTTGSLGYLIGSFLAGRLYDRVPGHPLMVSALFIISAMLALTPLVPVLWLLAGVLLVSGVAQGLLDVGGNTVLVWLHGDAVAPYMNGLHFFFGLGAFFSPIIVAQTVLVSGDITWAYWALALLMLPAAAWILRFPSPTQPQLPKQEGLGPNNVVQNTRSQYILVALIALFFFLYVGAELGYGNWVFTYAVEYGLANKATAAYLTSAYFGAFTLGRLLGIPIAARVRPRWILSVDLAGCIASVIVMMLFPHSLPVLWVGTLGLGFANASIFPTMLNLAERRMIITGNITSWFFVGGSSGGMFWPWLVGQVFESEGPSVVMVATLVDILLATAVFAAVMLYSARMAEKPPASAGAAPG